MGVFWFASSLLKVREWHKLENNVVSCLYELVEAVSSEVLKSGVNHDVFKKSGRRMSRRRS